MPFAPANYDGLGVNCNVLDLQSFEAVYKARLFNATSAVDRGRAAAEINMMLGRSGPSFNGSIQAGITYAQDNFQNWENLIATYDSGMVPGYSVQWNVDFNFNNNPRKGTSIPGLPYVEAEH